MLISKRDLVITNCVDKKNDKSFALDNVRIEPEKNTIIASNGHSLYAIVVPQISSDEFPECSGTPLAKEPLLIEYSYLEKARKNIPTYKYKPILENIEIRANEKEVELVATDLDTVDIVKFKNKTSEKFYPDWENITRISKEMIDTVKFNLSVSELELLVKVMKERKTEVIQFTAKDQVSMVTVNEFAFGEINDGFNAYIMPVKP